MAARTSGKRARYGTRQLVERVFQEPSSKGGLKTGELVSKVQELTDRKIPGPTIFQAARTLVKKKTLESVRDGREYRFSLVRPMDAIAPSPGAITATLSGSAKGEQTTGPAGPVSVGLGGTEPVIGGPVTPTSLVTLPQKLEPGQVLVLSIDGKTAVTLANVHGKAVVEHHAL